MARIRTIKPEFFRHEGLQDLEREHPGSYVMLTFAGLWTLCDKAGRFEWRPRTIKLDVLPFLDFDMGSTLMLLERFSFVSRYVHEGKEYGFIPSFTDHQRINGKEAQEPAKYPEPVEILECTSRGSIGEALGKQSRSQEGKGREREEEGNGDCAASAAPRARRAKPPERPGDVTEATWADWLAHRRAKRAPVTASAMDGIRNESEKAGLPLDDCLRQAMAAGWQSFRAEWLKNATQGGRKAQGMELIDRNAAAVQEAIRQHNAAQQPQWLIQEMPDD